jgi:hypothetical protein
MEDRPLVVLLGKSLLMDGVAVSLTGEQMQRMVRMDVECNDIRERLKSLEPDLIVFELDNPKTQSIISLLKDRPDLLLIGLDLDYCRAIVLNSHQHITQSMNELQHVVQTVANLKAISKERESNNRKR